ncbi:MAG: DUF3320 domain-containing protein, partial [Planctomycetota bacterium]
TYHRSVVARDRDKTRQMVLENLGWNVLRVWSPDWWYDANSATDNLDQQLRQLLEESRERPAVAEAAISYADGSYADGSYADKSKADKSYADKSYADETVEPSTSVVAEPPPEPYSSAGESKIYFARVKLTDATSKQDKFYDGSYDEDLKQMAMAILEREAPIRDDVLAKQIARAHGFARTGANIKTRIFDLLSDVVATNESTGRFLWASEEPLAEVEFRPANSDGDRRSVDEISIAELTGLIESKRDLLNEVDPAVAIARSIGLARLSQSARERIEEAIQLKLR